MMGDEEIETQYIERVKLKNTILYITYFVFIMYTNINKRVVRFFRLRNVFGQFNFIKHGF